MYMLDEKEDKPMYFSFYDGSVQLYCPSCKNIDNPLTKSKDGSEYPQGIGECPHCGAMYYMQNENNYWMTSETGQHDAEVIMAYPMRAAHNILYNVNVFDNEDNINITYMFRSFFARPNLGKVDTIYSKGYILINTKTGRTTAFKPSSVIGKRGPMYNSTYGLNEYSAPFASTFPSEAVDAIAQVLLKQLLKIGHADGLKKYMHENKSGNLGLNSLICFNRAPNMPNKLFYNLDNPIPINRKNAIGGITPKECFSKLDRFATFDDLLDLIGVPASKAIRKHIKIRPMTLITCRELQSIGFKKIDNLMKIMNMSMNTKDSFTFLETLSFKEKELVETTKRTRDIKLGRMKTHTVMVETCPDGFVYLMRRLIKENGETVTANKFIKTMNSDSNIYAAHRELRDTGNMLWQIENNHKEFKQFVDFTQSVKDLHDQVSALLDGVAYPNRSIKYMELEKSYECNIDSYEFRLPLDTDTVRLIGQQMHICVGSYREKLMRKSSTVIAMMKDGRFVTCIELAPNSSHSMVAIQAKTTCNYSPRGRVRDALLKFFEQNNIRINTADIDSNDTNRYGFQLQFDDYGLAIKNTSAIKNNPPGPFDILGHAAI
jgi:hypothetical protein